jgi:transglutaminase-like putative cysteine protease
MPLPKRFLLLALGAMFSILFIHFPARAADRGNAWETRYQGDPAVVLLYERIITINPDYSYTEAVHEIIRVQTEGGKSWGEIPIRYNRTRQEVREIEAHTLSADGRKVRAESIQDLNESGDAGVYSDDRLKMITMPNVVPGSTLDWRALVATNQPIIPGHFFDIVHLTSTTAIKECRYTLVAPKEMRLTIKTRNTSLSPTVTDSGERTTYSWVLKEEAKIPVEEAMPSPGELAKSVMISTLKDWRQVADWAWSLFRKNLSVTDDMKTKVREIVQEKVSAGERLQAVVEFLQNELRYVAMHFQSHGYEPHPAREIFANRYGDCKDYTLLGMALLSEIGIQAWPALMGGSRDRDWDQFLPMPSYFNHAILFFEFEGARRYLDLLENGFHFQTTPASLAGNTVFVVNDQGGFFAPIPPAKQADLALTLTEEVRIKADGIAEISHSIHFPNDASVKIREMLKGVPPEEKEKLIAAFESSAVQGGRVLERNWENLERPYQAVVLRIKTERSDWVQSMGDMMMFGPNQIPRGSRFTAPNRIHPIVFSQSSYIESRFAYVLPEGYEVVNLPQAVALKTPFADFVREYSANGGKISGCERLAFKSVRLPSAEYPAVQNFFRDMSKLTNNKLVIRKKG